MIELLRFTSKMESDEDNSSLSRLTQNTFLPNRIILDDELSVIASILESENRDFVAYKESTNANTSHSESTNKLESNTEKEGCMSYTAPEDAQRPRAVYDIRLDFRGI